MCVFVIHQLKLVDPQCSSMWNVEEARSTGCFYAGSVGILPKSPRNLLVPAKIGRRRTQAAFRGRRDGTRILATDGRLAMLWRLFRHHPWEVCGNLGTPLETIMLCRYSDFMVRDVNGAIVHHVPIPSR